MKLSYKYRFILWLFFFLSFILLIWVELFDIQILKSKNIINEASKQYHQRVISRRGDIRDRNGNLLVLDVITYDLYNNISNLNSVPEEAIQKLAKLLSIKIDDLKKRLSQKKDTKIFAGIDEQLANLISKERLSIVYPVAKVSRVYTHNKMAGHIIGFVNVDHKGQYGVEYSHEKLLTKITSKNNESFFPKGTDIVLTIDSFLQEHAEEELKKAVIKSRSQRGTIIALSPKTGEIYAWAVYPDFNPNIYYKEKTIKNWSITDIYQPGSTFKVLSVAAALENMSIDKGFSYFDTGKTIIQKRTIRNHDKTKPQYINLLELFKQSSNTAAAHIGLSMSPKTFYSSIKKFMIGTKTNIDLPGESSGLLLDHKKWKEIDLATTAFGQGAVSVTPLQLASAISAIANHGIWTQPHVLKGTWDSEYSLINESPYKIHRKEVLSQETADYVSELLKQSVRENLESMAYIAGDVPPYEVAGKTGTAQKIKPDGKGYLSGHTVASFIGYLPADDPQVLILVVIDDPKTEGGWGNTVCGPVFNNIAKMAARRIIEGV